MKFSRRRAVILFFASPETSWFFNANKAGVNKAPKSLEGIFKLVDAERKFYEEVGKTKLGDAPDQPDGDDNLDPDDGGNTGGGGGGFAG